MKKMALFVGIGICFAAGIFGITLAQVYKAMELTAFETSSAIAVLSAAEYDGKPSPVYRARLDHAAELFRAGKAPIIITTGARAPGEKISESHAGRVYLEKSGILPQSIVSEEESQNTKQSLMRISNIMKERRLENVILVSDPFHMYRALLVARGLGMNATGSPTRESPIQKNSSLEFRYALRETFLSLLHMVFDV